MRFLRVSVLCLLVMSTFAVAQEAPPAKVDSNDDPELAKLRKVLERSVDLFQVSSSQDPAIVMIPKSVLRWTNNERETQSVGELVLWLNRGQPAAAMATYNWSGKLQHEFDQLSREAVIARHDGNEIWKPKAGLKFQPIPNAPVVETSPLARLRQIKLLSEQFSATMMGWRADRSDRAELRRLPRELFRYQPESEPVIDGAVFAYVMGTDPEALLLIEAVKEKDQAEWQYAFVRQTSAQLQGRHLDQIVWSIGQNGARHDPAGLSRSLVSPLDLKTELAK